jgi:hypothetical protein
METIETRVKTRTDVGDTLWYAVEIQEYYDNPAATWQNNFVKRLSVSGGSFDPAQPSVMTPDPTLSRPVTSGAPPVNVMAPLPVNFSRTGPDLINNAEDPRHSAGPDGLRPHIGGPGGTIANGIGQLISNARTDMRRAEPSKDEWDDLPHMERYIRLGSAKIAELRDLLTRFPGQFRIK